MRTTAALVGALACFQASAAFMFPSAPKAPMTVVKGTPFKTIDGVTAVEDKSTAGMSVFEKAMYDFGKNYPVAYNKGFGPTTKAERWNGRHAMAGWIVLLATGYAQAHGMIPQGELDPNVWGQWVITNTDPVTKAVSTIPLDRATILIAHLHLAAVGVFSAYNKYTGPFEKLALENGEKDEPAAGLFVPIRFGLSREAELLNGRLAMLGLVVLGTVCGTTGQDFLQVIDQALGGLLLKA